MHRFFLARYMLTPAAGICNPTMCIKEINAMATKIDKRKELNPDPITGAPGSHPVGTGLGSAGAGAAGAALGAMAGPVGAVAGAAIGAVAGGYAGKAVAEKIDPTAEETYWRENYIGAKYYDSAYDYDSDYLPAYQAGWDSRAKYNRWEDAETQLARDWESRRGRSRLGWDKARLAARDAWDRIERAIPGDSDRDGK